MKAVSAWITQLHFCNLAALFKQPQRLGADLSKSNHEAIDVAESE